MKARQAIAVIFGCLLVLVPSIGAPSAQTVSATGGLTVPSGFRIQALARVPSARELVALPNGDLIAGTGGRDVYIVPGAEETAAGQPEIFTEVPDAHAAGVAFASDRSVLYVGSEHGVYAIRYAPGQRKASSVSLIASVRTGPIAPNSDGDVHVTTSVAYDRGTVYVSVGSSCNACTEVDPTRASILTVPAGGGRPVKRATRIRNAIALAVNPQSHALWAGNAGQDNLPPGHPYEFLDNVTSHAGVPDYGWPECEENHHAYVPGANCANTIAPLIAVPAYSTFIGAVFYPTNQAGPYAFPERYRGTLFATVHGSWHVSGASYSAAPEVLVITMDGDHPRTPVNWEDPRVQWQTFVAGFQPRARERIGRPTGIAVGPQGSLFVADDMRGMIYRVRPR